MSEKESFPHLRLYSYWRSSCSYRVRIALAYKGIKYENVPVNLLKREHKQPEYLRLNPMGFVPSLEATIEANNSFVMTQSMAIIDYLEQVKAEPSLYPKDPRDRARALTIANIICCDIQPLQNLQLLQLLESRGVNKEAHAKLVMERGFEVIEKLIIDSNQSSFCVGSNVTIADVFLVPQVYNAHRFGVDMNKFPKISLIVTYLDDLKAFKEAHPNNQPDAL